MALSRLEKAQTWLWKAVMGLLYGLFRLLSPRSPAVSKRLPAVSNPLLAVSAMQLAQKIRRREVCRPPPVCSSVCVCFREPQLFFIFTQLNVYMLCFFRLPCNHFKLSSYISHFHLWSSLQGFWPCLYLYVIKPPVE